MMTGYASGTETAEPTESEAEETTDTAAAEYQYDTQPSDPVEVKDAIDSYKQQYMTELEAGGQEAADQLMKPHWEAEVNESWMPEGYYCDLVEGDERFPLPYFTFFEKENGEDDEPQTSATESEEPDTAESEFDQQPGSLEEVEQLISTYKVKLEEAGTNQESVSKPRWQFAVQNEWMPLGYLCREVTDDEAFGKSYYTFFEEEGVYDTQPTSLWEVQRLIEAYEAEFDKALEKDGIEAAIKIRKPHWKYQVKEAFMPRKYICEEVKDDEEFGVAYFTFFAKVKTLATTWLGQGTESDPFRIATKEQLIELSDSVDAGITYEGKHFVLAGDLDLSSITWAPIGNSGVKLRITHLLADSPRSDASYKPFRGTFDGAGHTISNLKVNGPGGSSAQNDYKGLFGAVEDATIKNLTINGANIKGGAGTGTLIGYAYGSVTVSRVTVNSTVVTSGGSNNFGIGGMIGVYDHEETSKASYKLEVSDSVVNGLNLNAADAYEGSTTSRRTAAGGLIGILRSYSAGTNSTALGKAPAVSITNSALSGNATIQGCAALGGIVGYAYYVNSNNNKLLIKDADVGSLTINAQGGTGNREFYGGIIGYVENTGSSYNEVLVEGAKVTANINNSGSQYLGGMIGKYLVERYSTSGSNGVTLPGTQNLLRVTNSDSRRGEVAGTIYGEAHTGGAVGDYNTEDYTTKNEILIDGIDTSANVTSYGGDHAGGIIGRIHFTDASTNTGSIGSKATIIDCKTTGNVSSYRGACVGGIVGLLNATYSKDVKMLVENCHSSGKVSATSGTSGYYVGGINGETRMGEGSSNSTVTFNNCTSSSTVSAEHYYVGGLFGYLEVTSMSGANASTPDSENKRIFINDSYATGNISTTGGTSYYVGGLVGHAHGGGYAVDDTIVFTNCWASGDVSGSSYYNGGFVGHPANGVTFKNCYATGDVYGGSYYNGGFVGFAYGAIYAANTKYENCYATGNVTSSSHDAGGFVGMSQGSTFRNCYAVGSVRGSGARNGGFAGRVYTDNSSRQRSNFINCYGTGTVPGSGNGFVGENAASSSTTYTNCFFDKTTTTKTSSGAGGGVTGVTTKDMIDPDTFSSWGILNVWHVSASKRQRSDDNPWYIDKDATYPYLYYQADGFDTDGDKLGDGYLDPQKEFPTDFDNTNYFLGVVYTVDGAGKKKVMVPYRYDYEHGSAASLSFQAMTVGSNRAYFPYAAPSGSGNYNTRQYWFEDGIKNSDSDGPQWMDTNRTYKGDSIGKVSFGANQKISFGSYSRTNIVAFSAGPNAVKTNDAPIWEDGDKTYVGNKTTYKVTFTNYSTTSAWKQVEMIDPLAKGVTLVNDFVFLYRNEQEIKLENMTGNPRLAEDEYKYNQYELDKQGGGKTAIPYFTYSKDETSGSATEGRYILEIFNLPELDVAIIDASGVTFDEYYLEFVAQVEEEAMTPEGKYPEDQGINLGSSLKNYNEDNIRNRGDVPGVMHFYDPVTLFDPSTGFTTDNRDPLIVNGEEIVAEVVIPLDDEDIDPIYLGIIITYDSNHRNFVGSEYEDGTAAVDTRIDKDYMHVGKDTHTVIPNDDPNEYTPPADHPRKDFTNFDAPSDLYDFDGWFFFVEIADEKAYDKRADGKSGDELEEALTEEPLETKVVAISLAEIGLTDADAYKLMRTGHTDAKVMQAVENRFAIYGNNSGRDHSNVVRLTLYAKWKLKNIKFDFIKKNLNDDGMVDVSFDLYYWEGSEAPQSADVFVITSGTGANVAAGKWIKVNEDPIKSLAEDSSKDIAAGLVQLEFYETGYYQLVETSTLTGYYLPEVQWLFVTDLTVNPFTLQDPVTKAKTGTNPYQIDFKKKLIPGTEDDPEYTWSLANYYLNSVKIEKKGPKGDLLDGAEFVLEKYLGTNADPSQDTNAANWSTSATGTTGDGSQPKGVYQFGKDSSSVNTLAPGHYRIKETKAAAGHTLLKEPIYFKLPLEYIDTVPEGVNTSDADYTHVNDDDDDVYGFINLTYTVTDEANFELPASGRMNVLLYCTVIGAVMVLLGVGLYGYRRKKVSGR